MAKVLSEFGTLVPAAADGEKADKSSVEAIVNVYGSKNLNSYPYYETTTARNGISYVDNNNGSVTASNTASSDSYLTLHSYSNPMNNCVLKKGTYILSGCPNGGSANTYYINVFTYINGQIVVNASDFGSGASFTIEDDDTPINLSINVKSGVALPVGGITFYPMLRDARITDDTFVPYAMTNRELTEIINSNKFGTTENITVATNYTVENDGYVVLAIDPSTAIRSATVTINGVNFLRGTVPANSNYGDVRSVFIKKGTVVKWSTATGGDITCSFIPLT